jgi:hypothetical protein
VNLRHATPVAAALLLAACVQQPQVAIAPAGPNLNAGIAAACAPTEPKLVPGATAQAEMRMDNDGGWCAVRVADMGAPFKFGLVKSRPAHGRVVIRPAGSQTFLDYVPAAGYTGPDSFTVALAARQAGQADSTVHVTVQVAQKGA